MKPESFNKIVNERCVKIKKVLASKAKEYATEDRLHNFKRASVFMNKTPATVCWGFAMKHFTSVADIVDQVESGKKIEPWLIEEKIGDSINYLILLEAILKEQKPDL